MRRAFWTAALAVCALVLGLGIYLIGCTDKKVIQPTEPKEYYIYFADGAAPNTYWRYNTGTMTVDSFYLPYNSILDGFGISPDGKTMYLHPDDGIVEVSLDSFVVVAEHPIYLPKGNTTGNGHEVIISPDGRYMAVLERYLHILDMTDFSVIYSDTTTYTGHGWFTQDSKSFFCALRDDGIYYALEITLDINPEVALHSFDDAAPWRIKTSPDGGLWFLYLGVGRGIFVFQNYDVEKDSAIFEKALYPGAGDLEVTPNGHYVIYTQPGDMASAPTTNTFTIFDVYDNQIDREVVAYFDSIQAVYAVGELAITPDGRHLIGISWHSSGLMDYDLLTHKFRKIFTFDNSTVRWLFSLSSQSKP